MQTKENKVLSGFQVMFLFIISIISGTCIIFLVTYFPNLSDNHSLVRLMALIYIAPLFIAIFCGITVTLPPDFLGIKFNQLSFARFMVLVIIIGIISSVFTLYFIRGKPVLFDLEEQKTTVSFFLLFPFLCFSFIDRKSVV